MPGEDCRIEAAACGRTEAEVSSATETSRYPPLLRQSVEDSFTGVLKKTASHVSKNQEAVVAVTTKMEESMRHHSDMLSKVCTCTPVVSTADASGAGGRTAEED